jgi:hypothetical protein
MRITRWVWGGLVAVTFAASCPAARASVPAAEPSYRKPSTGGVYVFVMIGSDPDRGGSILSDDRKVESREVRRIYPRSGLYRAEGPAVPLWTIDWYAPASAVDLSSDGVHLILRESGGSSAESGAIRFYANGRLLRSYKLGDLVDDERQIDRFGTTITHWMRNGHYDDAKQRYTLTTVDGNEFVFDVRTGSIISASRPGQLWRRVLLLTLAVAVGATVVGVATQLIRRWRNPLSDSPT